MFTFEKIIKLAHIPCLFVGKQAQAQATPLTNLTKRLKNIVRDQTQLYLPSNSFVSISLSSQSVTPYIAIASIV